MWDWYLQADGRKVRRMSEATLRIKLRTGKLSGLELVRRADQTQWYALHDAPMYAQEVAFEGAPQDHARLKATRGFAIHFLSYAAVCAITGFVPPVVLFWGIAIVLHGARTYPAARALYLAGKLPFLSPPASSPAALKPGPAARAAHQPRTSTAPQPAVGAPVVASPPSALGAGASLMPSPALAGPDSAATDPYAPTSTHHVGTSTSSSMAYQPTMGAEQSRSLQDRQLHEAVRGRLFGDEGGAPVQIGRYRLDEQIGVGGMGLVYRAHDESLDRPVALKLLRAEVDASAGTERLQREARSMAKLSHPNVVTVFDVGVFEGAVFVAMEYVQGVTLRAWLDQSHPVSDVIGVLRQAGEGLSAAHAGGLVHRDFKPENVIVGDDGRVRVLDFGLAKPVDGAATQDALTRTGTVLGTPRYMTPEQFRGEPADARSDQFSYAVVLYEALYGAHPYQPPDDMPLPRSVLKGRLRPTPPRVHIPAALRDAILRGVSHDPDDRHASIRAMLDALGPVPTTSHEVGTLAAVVRRLLGRRQGSHAAQMLDALDNIETVLAELDAKVATLERQVRPRTTDGVAQELAAAREALDQGANDDDDATRAVRGQQVAALEQRQSGIALAHEVIARLRARRSVAENQLEQLHLDLLRAEADDASLPDLTGPLQELRFQVDAAQEVEAMLAPRA